MNALDKAIKMHRMHLRDPKTATDKSQRDMMKLLLEHKSEMGQSSSKKKHKVL